jgi:predicted MPP superfamily phosphohydrolase
MEESNKYENLVRGLRAFNYGGTMTVYDKKGEVILIDHNPKTYDELRNHKKELFKHRAGRNRTAVPNKRGK